MMQTQGKIAVFAAKVVVTGACFWYIARQIDVREVWSAIRQLDFRWAVLAVALAMLQIPLIALRWRTILQALAACNERMTRAAMIAITAIGAFFSQVLPSIAGEGVRAWFLVRLGARWRDALASVVIDRGVGAGLLIALGFVILLLPSGLTALRGYRTQVILVYGALLFVGLLALALTPRIVPLLERWRYTRWLAALAADAHRALLGPTGPAILGLACLVHTLTIAEVWLLGQAQGLALPLPDAAVLFAVMVGVALVPISIGGWGLRELAVISLLAAHGVAPEQALLFSVCFGLTMAVGSLPGALAWLIYSVAPAARTHARE